MNIGNAFIQLAISFFCGILFAVAGFGLDFFLIASLSLYAPMPLTMFFYPLGTAYGVIMMSRRHLETGSVIFSVLGAFVLFFGFYFFSLFNVRGLKGDADAALAFLCFFAILPVIGAFSGYHIKEFIKEFKKELTK